jgi:hypothetical protein
LAAMRLRLKHEIANWLRPAANPPHTTQAIEMHIGVRCRKVPAWQIGYGCSTVISRRISSNLNPIASAAGKPGRTATS